MTDTPFVKRLKRKARQARNIASALLILDAGDRLTITDAEERNLRKRGLIDNAGRITDAGRKAAAGIRELRRQQAEDKGDHLGEAQRRYGAVDGTSAGVDDGITVIGGTWDDRAEDT